MDFDDLLTDHRPPLPRPPRRAGALPGALRAHPGRRVPGHEPGPERARSSPWVRCTATSASWATRTRASTASEGADLRNILEFEEAFPDVTVIVLEQNYRSTQTILDAANAVIDNNQARKPKHLWTDQGQGARIVRYHAEDEGDEARWVVRTMTDLHETEGYRWGDMAVFYRTNAQSRVVEEALMRAGTPYKVVGGTRFYDRREIKDALAYLRAVVNPADEVSVKRVLNVPKRGVGDTTVARLDAFANAEGMHLRRRAAPRRRGGGVGPRGPGRVGVRRPARRRSPPCCPKAPATCSRPRWTPAATWPSWRPSTRVESAGRLENLGELVGSAREFTRRGRVHGAGGARGRQRRGGRRRQPGHPHDAPHRQGAGVPGRVPGRRRGGDLPAHPGPDRARRAGGGAPPGLRGHHPRPRAAVHHPRVEPHALRLDAVQPAQPLRRGDPGRAGRADRRPGRAGRWPVGAAGTATARESGGGGATTIRPGSSTASGWSMPPCGPASARPSRSRPGPRRCPLRLGDDVRHATYGEGVIVNITGHGEKAEARVRFPGLGEKTFLLAWTPLEKV